MEWSVLSIYILRWASIYIPHCAPLYLDSCESGLKNAWMLDAQRSCIQLLRKPAAQLITPGGTMESRSYAQPCHGGQQSHQSPSDVAGNMGSVLEVAQSSSCLPLHILQPWASAAPPQSWESSSARHLSAFHTAHSPITSFTHIALSWNFLMFLHL